MSPGSLSHGLELTPDLLRAHGRALRSLARSLMGDEHAAEDVVQETWLACLRHPGVIPERVSAWLGTVTKHLALHRLRGDGRRETRERRAAAAERLEALQQHSLEHEEAVRAVTGALLALEEPLKTVLLLRYYEDRTPNEIAHELGVPLGTIKSRLARGLECLRGALRSEFARGGASEAEERRRRALCVLVGLPAAKAIGPAAAPAAAWLAAPLLVPAAALVALGVWAWRTPPQESLLVAGAPQQSGDAQTALSDDPAREGTVAIPTPAQGGGTSAVGRESVAAQPPRLSAPPPPPAATFSYRVAGQVRDEHDLPFSGARVFLGPHGFPLNQVAVTDEQGRFAFAFDGRRATLDCAFSVDDGGGRHLGLRELQLVSGRELQVDVGLGPVASSGRVLGELRGGEMVIALGERGASVDHRIHYSLEGAEREGVEQAAGLLAERIRHAGRPSEPLDRAPVAERSPDGRVTFLNPPPTGFCEREPASLELVLLAGVRETWSVGGTVHVEGGLLSLSGRTSWETSMVEGALAAAELGGLLRAEPADQPAPATIRGTVRDAQGRPVGRAMVAWSAEGETRTVLTDGDGRYALEDLPPGKAVVRAGGGDHGRARMDVSPAAGEEASWSPVLERGHEIEGRLVNASDGSPLAGLLVELWSASLQFLWCDATFTDAGGRFAVPNVPDGPLEVHVYASGDDRLPSTFPVHLVRSVFAPGDAGTIALDDVQLATSTLAVTVLGPDGDPLPGAEVRVWQGSTGRGVFAGEPDEEGKLVLAGLPHGYYRLDVGGPFGWRSLGTTWVNEETELEPVRFEPLGLAELASPPADGPLSAMLWSAHADVFGLVEALELGRVSRLLHPGSYVLCAAAGAGRRSEAALELEPGATQVIVLGPDGLGARPTGPANQPVAVPEPGEAVSCRSCHSPLAAPIDHHQKWSIDGVTSR